MQLPIGYDNFQELIDNKLDFVDKTLFIKELLDDKSSKIALITRPRRFGKTLNLSMLQYFFAPEVDGKPTGNLFDGLKITQVPGDYMEHQGKYPVIFVTLKGVNDGSFEHALQQMAVLISQLYGRHRYLLSSENLAPEDKDKFQRMLNEKANQATLESSLQYLTQVLHKHHGVKPWLLIDEYDSPIQAAYLNGYYKEMVTFMRNMFGAALKTNPDLNRAVITGILRVSKESLFSGLNNIEVFSMMRRQYGEYFGFTEDEVSSLLQQSGLSEKAKEIKNWYNGYQIEELTLYNPWSIVNCIKRKGLLQPYWVNTSGNALIQTLLLKNSNEELRMQFETILQGNSIETRVDENIVFVDINSDPSSIWSLLLFAGYLKTTELEYTEFGLKAKLKAPNEEVMRLYRTMVYEWMKRSLGIAQYEAFFASLANGEIEKFKNTLQNYLLESMSFFDASGQHPENFYHGFVLGLVVGLRATHHVESNKESGFGRYDVMLIPKDTSKLGIVIEFKVADQNEELLESAQKALQQTIDKQYATELKKRGIANIMHLGLAFRGKQVEIAIS